jgi:archaeosortase A (PGF-CTERM-specific)
MVKGSKEKEEADLFFTITRVALITSVFYFPFSEFSFLGNSLIYITAKIVSTMLNLFNVSVYTVYPSFIYLASSSFHEVYKPVEIILACTAIQSMVLFTGLIFGISASSRQKIKAFFVSVPLIYVLNIFRNVFVVSAYFEQWFGSPLQSFYIAHNVISRIGVFASLIVIVYAVFIILPETLDLIEDFFRFFFKKKTK